jgi:hypothetical protein
MSEEIWGKYYNFDDDFDLVQSEPALQNMLTEYMYILLALLSWSVYCATISFRLYYAKK